MRFVRGRVLDLGCGAGRVGLHLQSRGHEVVGIDVSPLAVEIARRRGSLTRGWERSTAPFAAASASTRPCCSGTISASSPGSGRVAASCGSWPTLPPIEAGSWPAPTTDTTVPPSSPAATTTQPGARKDGGVERLRLRYRQYATPWYDVLFASREEVTRLVKAPAGSPAASSAMVPATSPCSNSPLGGGSKGEVRPFATNAACVIGISRSRKVSAAAAYCRISYCACSGFRSEQKCMRSAGCSSSSTWCTSRAAARSARPPSRRPARASARRPRRRARGLLDLVARRVAHRRLDRLEAVGARLADLRAHESGT